jgi:hypothetical protein
MPADDSPPDNTTKIVLIVIGGVVAAVLVVALTCGVGVYFFVKSAQQAVGKVAAEVEKMQESLQAANAAQAFLTDLSFQVDRAYADTTRNYQANHKLDDLRAYVDKHPVLKQPGNLWQPVMPLPAVVNDRVTVRMMLNGNQATVVTFDMVKEGGVWKVDELVAP